MTRRVVVTGMSVVTALGMDLEEFWERLCAGKKWCRRIDRFDSADFKVHFGGEIKDFNPEQWIDPKEAKRLDRFCQFALVAAQKAVAIPVST